MNNDMEVGTPAPGQSFGSMPQMGSATGNNLAVPLASSNWRLASSDSTGNMAGNMARSLKEKVVLFQSEARKGIRQGPDPKPRAVDVNHAKLAGERHDWFNILFIPFIVFLIVFNMDVSQPWYKFWWDGTYFYTLWVVTMIYFLIDLAWVLLIPSCVKSPQTIIIHHVLTITYLFLPFFHAQRIGWLMATNLSVEFNTWFLIVRRTHNKGHLEPWAENVDFLTSLRLEIVTKMFYLSWFVIRCIIYPFMVPLIVIAYTEYSAKVGWFNVLLVAPILQTCFVLLNAKWTKDLVCPAPPPPDAPKGAQGL